MKKKLLLITGLILMATVSLFVSCDDETTSNPPTLEFASPSTPSVQVDKGESVGFIFVAKANLNTMSSLQKVTIVAKYSSGGSDQVLDTNVPSSLDKQFSVTKYYTVPTATPYGTTITCTVKVTDKDGQFAEQSFTLNVTNLSDLNIYDVTMGAQGNISLGSAFASDSGKVYMSADAKKWQTRVDFLYFFDVTNSHSIAAPNDGTLASATSLVKDWTVKNATKFKVVSMDEAEFNALTSSAQIDQKYSLSSATEKSIAPSLGDGTVLQKSFVLFKTVKNKSGAIMIKSIVETPVQKESSIAITVKVER